MIIIENKKYFRICDDCNDKKEITKSTFNSYRNKNNQFCSSCYQKGKRNHQYGIPSWNKGLTKKTDERIREYSKKDSLAKIGNIPWNFGKTYFEIKGEDWAKNFRERISKIKTGKKLGKRRFSTKRNQSYKYFRKLIKIDLYENWVLPILERDNFSCKNCGSKKNLEVHHVRAYRDILLLVSKRVNLDLNKYIDFSDEQFDYFVKEVVKEHKLEDGITYCMDCHKMFDKYRDKFDKREIKDESKIYAFSE